MQQNSGGLILNQSNGNGKTNIYIKPKNGSSNSIVKLSDDGTQLSFGSSSFSTAIKGSSTTISGLTIASGGIKTNIIQAPTTSGGSTYGPGSDG
jgi:hypothetical protein